MEHKKKVVITTGMLLLMGMSLSHPTKQVVTEQADNNTALMVIKPLEELIQLPQANTRAAPDATRYMEKETNAMAEEWRAEFQDDIMLRVYKRNYANGSLSMKYIRTAINLLSWSQDKKAFALQEIEVQSKPGRSI